MWEELEEYATYDQKPKCEIPKNLYVCIHTCVCVDTHTHMTTLVLECRTRMKYTGIKLIN